MLQKMLFGKERRKRTHSKFAKVLQLPPMQVHHAVDGYYVPSVPFLLQVANTLKVRAEWLLFGVGPVFVTDMNRDAGEFVLAPTIRSSFSPFNTLLIANGIKQDRAAGLLKPRKKISPISLSAAANTAHACKIAGKPVFFFLGGDAGPQGLDVVRKFLAPRYITAVAMTGSVLPYDLERCEPFPERYFDVNYVIRTAALSGIGCAEALGRLLPDKDKRADRSLCSELVNSTIPLSVLLEMGDVVEHLYPAMHGAEIGAAWGAASYIDYLIFTEQVRKFGGPGGGVFIILGEPARAWRLLSTSLKAIRSAVATTPITEFAVIQLGTGPTSSDISKNVMAVGGTSHFVQGSYLDAAEQFFAACTDVYDGKPLTND